MVWKFSTLEDVLKQSKAETLLSEDRIQKIIKSENITVEIEKETDEEVTNVRFFINYILLFVMRSCYA